jgi:HlyD family secretion protein
LEERTLRSRRVVVDVLSSDAVRVRPGAEMIVEEWGGDAPLRARVLRVEPSGFTKVSALGVEEQRVNVIADVLDPPDELGDGFRVEARIVVWEAADVVRVPVSALFRRGDGWSVFVVEGGRALRRDVEVGQRGTFEAEVRAGLEPGEHVVLHPSDRVQDTARVRPL